VTDQEMESLRLKRGVTDD